ncbi:beta strand repeat-containing protein [Robiginitalea sediminis]|uniref:beta strand repeat-containing protein n=1 Tax=Robiginitalea sediminis TaxID=1982593 RepID=UPI001E47F525|nr:Calx-beta domain-containing protein [Robiginitalea sediminis]
MKIIIKGIVGMAFCLFGMTALQGQETFRDTFSSVSYSQNNGTQSFSTDWAEQGDDNSPSGGRIEINSNQLRFQNMDGATISRDLNLAGATSATLTLDFNRTSGNETIAVQLWDGSVYNTVAFLGGSGTLNYTLTAAERNADASIQFVTASGGWSTSETIFIDNVQFTATFVPAITLDEVTVDEGAGTVTLTATHTGVSAGGPFTVTYTTADVTALAGADYTASSGTLSFSGTVGDTETIIIPITDDTLYEGDEAFEVQLTGTSDPSVLISDTGTATITDNEVILDDVPLSLYRNLNGNYDYTTAGGSFRTAHNNVDPCAITSTSNATLTAGIPVGATIKVAYLFWSHSGATPDSEVTFEGQNVAANLAYSAGFSGRTFYGFLADVTSIVSGIPNPMANTFDMTDLDIDTSAAYCGTATVLGAWSLMVFYEEGSLPASTINLYYGFDVTQNAGTSFTLDSFYAISAAGSKATFLSYEGDDTLDGSSGGSTNPEELSITNQLGFNFILSGDGGQTGNNAYNSTVYDELAGVNNTGIYGLDLDTYDIASFVNPLDTQVTANVDVGQDLVISSAVVIRVPSNLISGTVFEDLNYPGGAGRSLVASGGVGIPNATVELYDALGTLQATTTSDTSGDYSFGGMADGNYRIRVLNESVRSTRAGGTGCTDCYAVQTFRTEFSGGSPTPVTNEVGGANPAATADAGAGTLTGAQTVSPVLILGGGTGGIHFGFNFNTIVNTNEEGQGSLEQFIVNANALDESGIDIEANGIFDPAAGQDVSVFMIPPTGDALGRTADGGFNGSYFDIFISNGVDPTDLTGDNIHIDGRTQTAYSGDTNSGTAGSGGTPVGTTGVLLPDYELPEIQIHRNAGDVLVNEGNNNVVRNVSVYANNNAGIRIDNGSLSVLSSLLGVDATGANAGNIDFGIENQGGDLLADGNYIATNTDVGILVAGGTSSIIQNNHVFANGDGTCDDNIRIEGGAGSVTITQNLIEDGASLGIDAASSSGNLSITENTITGSGQVPGNCGGGPENMGLELAGSNSSVSNNIIYSNGGAGLATTGSGTGNLFSQNSFYANGTVSDALGIDLDGDGVTLNDSGDADSGFNNLLNFPIITAVYLSGSDVVIKGYSRPGAILEFFFTDINEGTASAGDNQLGNTVDYGEGQVYIGTVTEGSGADLDSGSSSYTDMDGNTDTTNRFHVQIPIAPGTTFGEWITATATVSNSTSEFAPMSQIRIQSIITNRRITYRVNPN